MNGSVRFGVSVIVVSYNTREMTLECLRSLFRETRVENCEVIVLDNASADGSARAIRAEFEDRVRLLESAENCGFAKGNNIAAEAAQGEYLLLLNPDVVVLDRAIDRLLEFARTRPLCGIWGGRTLFGDRSLNPASCWSRQTMWSLVCQALGLSSLYRKSSFFNSEGIGGWDRQGVREVDIVSGCFLLIRRDLWRRLDGFREVFFMYGEEADLCLRARAFGAQPATTSAATIVHYGGASDKIRVEKMVRLLRAKADLIRLHFPPYQRHFACRLLACWPRSRAIAHGVLARCGRRDSQEKALTWKDIVAREIEWYSPVRQDEP